MALKNKTDLTNDKNTALPDNTSGDIVPATDRGVRQDVIDSMLNMDASEPEQTVAGPVDFTGGLKVAGVLITATSFTPVSIDNTDSPYSASWLEDISVDASAGAVIVNLPTASGNSGSTLFVTKTDISSFGVTLDPDGSETINDDSDKIINYKNTSLTIRSDGANVGIR